MTEPFYTASARIEKVKGTHRRAHLDTGDVVEFGVHGRIKEHYNLGSEPDLPLPVDFLVAATGA